MYDSKRRELYWPHMGNGLYATVRGCQSVVENYTHRKSQRQLKIFFSEVSFLYVGTDILGFLPKTEQGNKFVVVITYSYSKLTKAIPTTKRNNTTVARIILEHRVANYSMPSKPPTEDGSQFVSKTFRGSLQHFSGE